jgi:hypothetical protein
LFDVDGLQERLRVGSLPEEKQVGTCKCSLKGREKPYVRFQCQGIDQARLYSVT